MPLRGLKRPSKRPNCSPHGLEFGHFVSPKGRKQNSPWASALGRHPREHRPEGAAECRALFPEKNVRRKRLDAVSIRISSQCKNSHRSFTEKTACTGKGTGASNTITIYLYTLYPMRFGRPFRAISLCVSIPGLKPWAVFYAPFGRLEHTREKVQTTGTGVLARQFAENSFTIGLRWSSSSFSFSRTSLTV